MEIQEKLRAKIKTEEENTEAVRLAKIKEAEKAREAEEKIKEEAVQMKVKKTQEALKNSAILETQEQK